MKKQWHFNFNEIMKIDWEKDANPHGEYRDKQKKKITTFIGEVGVMRKKQKLEAKEYYGMKLISHYEIEIATKSMCR